MTKEVREFLRAVFNEGYRMGYGNGHHDGNYSELAVEFNDDPGECFGLRCDEDGKGEQWAQMLQALVFPEDQQRELEEAKRILTQLVDTWDDTSEFDEFGELSYGIVHHAKAFLK